jgi:hypothetical protein
MPVGQEHHQRVAVSMAISFGCLNQPLDFVGREVFTGAKLSVFWPARSNAEVGLAPNNTAVTAPPFDPSKPYKVMLKIGGRLVNVDDGFLRLSPQQQQASVNEIARSLGIGESITWSYADGADISRNATAGTVGSAPQRWQNAPIIAPPPQPAPSNAATAQRYPGSWELAPKPLSDAEVGLAPVQRYPGGWEFDPVTKRWHRNQ